MTHSDNQIVARVQSGDTQAFGELYDAYVKKIYNFIYFKTGHKETAEDLVSLVFTKALANIGSFDTERGYFSAWLYRVARNAVIDHYRTKKHDTNIDDIWGMADGTDLAHDVDARQQLLAVRDQLRLLSPRQREVVIMRVWQEMNYAEIALILNKSEASCKMAFSRAVRILQKNLASATLLWLLLLS